MTPLQKKIIIALCALFSPVSLQAKKSNAEVEFQKVFKQIKAQKVFAFHEKVGGNEETLLIHSKKISQIMKDRYSLSDLKNIESLIKPATEIKVHNGLVQASDRPLNSLDDPTHYDAIWVRDSLWVYLGLQAQGRNEEAKPVLMKMLDYISSSDQLDRLKNVIKGPTLIDKIDGSMQVVHIRFDGKSSDFKDVQVGGANQKWNHKQNDALGLFFDLVLRAIQEGSISPHDISTKQYEALAALPAYFSQIKFYDMEDAGSWEEIEKVATSSVGLVTSSLETLNQVVEEKSPGEKEFTLSLIKAAKDIGVQKFLDRESIQRLIDKGYDRISKQLQAGGESPLYPKNDSRFRKADVALLNLIYPARLSRLSIEQKKEVLKIVKTLTGEVGIRRYLKDSYQSGNFWFPLLNNHEAGNTDDTSSAEKFKEREEKFIENSEAQWFFDSWYSTCVGLVSAETKEKSLVEEQIYYFNRSLAQITSDPGGLSADGNKVKSFALPESYNTLALKKERAFAPSPITPLNWAKASLSLALKTIKKGSL